MNELISRYCPRVEFDSYEDLKNNYCCNIPENFNFAYDIVDEWAKINPYKTAIVWTNDDCEIKSFTFGDIKKSSNRAANLFVSLGIKRETLLCLY